MAEARLASGLWVAALRRRCELLAAPVYVTHRGDETAGAVWLLAVGGPEAALFAREYDLAADRSLWAERARGAAPELAAMAAREVSRDRDLWVLEIEAAPEVLAALLQD